MFFGNFWFLAKNTPKLQKLFKKRPKSSICLIIFHISSKKSSFWHWPFFSDLWHGIAHLSPLWRARRKPFLQLSPRVLGGDGRRRKSPLDGAAYLQSKRWQHITTVSFLSAFIIVSTGKHKNPYKLNGSKLVPSLSLLFSKGCCFKFLYQAGLPSINVVDNLLYQPHLYLYPY